MDIRTLLPMVPALFRPVATVLLNRLEAVEQRQADHDRRLAELERKS